MKIMVINGPNLNMLGIREPDVYGSKSHDDLVLQINEYAIKLNIEVEVFQSNHEGGIINAIQRAQKEKFGGIVINPAAYTHYSYAIYDAIKGSGIHTVEVHISNVHKREEFRHTSVIAPACDGQICGLGFLAYNLAIQYLYEKYQQKN